MAGLFLAEILCVSNWTSRQLSHARSLFPNRGQRDGVKEVNKFPCPGLPKSSRPTAGGCGSIPFPCGDHPSCALQKATLQTDPLGALTFEREGVRRKSERRAFTWRERKSTSESEKEAWLRMRFLSSDKNLSITQHDNSTFFPEALIMAIWKGSTFRRLDSAHTTAVASKCCCRNVQRTSKSSVCATFTVL